MASKALQWDGSQAPEGEGPGTVVTAWEVAPHPTQRKYDCLIERSGPAMHLFVADSIDSWLERYTEEELRQGVTLKFRLVDMHLEDIPTED